MILILLSYIVWLPAIIGFGSPLVVVHRKQAIRSEPSQVIFLALTGLAVLGTAANLLNFFVPISPIVAFIVLVSGWLLFILSARSFFGRIRLSFVAFGMVLLAYIAYSAHKPVALYDTGLYHLQSVKWITESKTPLGLANLHGRFGFNSLWFSIAAILEIPYLQGKSSFILNGILLFAYGLAIGSAVSTLLAKEIKLSNIFLLLTTLVWLTLARGSRVNSVSPDFPIVLLTLVSTFASIEALESSDEWIYYSFVAFFVAILTITIKFSAIPLLLAPMVVLAWSLYKYRGQLHDNLYALKTTLKASLIAVLLLLIPWVMRGVLLSGCIAFPVSFGCLSSLDWAVPISCPSPDQGDGVCRSVQSEAEWIRSWARQPRQRPEVVLADWNWLIPWLDRFVTSEVVRKTASLLFVGSVLLWMAKDEKKISSNDHANYVLPALASFLGIIFWFLTAPDIRFGEGYFWSLGLLIFSSGIYSLYMAYPLTKFNRPLLVVLAAITLAYANGLGPIDHQPLFARLQETFLGWPTIPVAEVEERVTKDGVRILSPVSGDQCWGAELPCTPYFRPKLKVALSGTGQARRFQIVALVDEASGVDQVKEASSPLIIVEPSLKGAVRIDPQIRTPLWGIETSDSYSLLWLGRGEAEGIGGTLWSTQMQTIQAVFEVEPGPARPDRQRAVEITLTNAAGVQEASHQFDQATQLIFTMQLEPGRNDFQFAVLDEATVSKQPNGDTRPLLVLLHRITIKPLGEN